VKQRDDTKPNIKLDIRNSPEPADGKSLIMVRAQVYTTVGGVTHAPPSQKVSFLIEDGGEGQSNAVFVGTGNKSVEDKSNGTTGWTPWHFFTSTQAGSGMMLAYLSADKTVSNTKGFQFAPPEGDSGSVLEVYGQGYYWSNFSPYPNMIGAYATSPYYGSAFFFEAVGKDAMTIRESSGRYIVVQSREWVTLGQPDVPGTVFSKTTVKGKPSVISLQLDGRYVCAWPTGYQQELGGGYDLVVAQAAAGDPSTFFEIHDAPIPPYTLTITQCPASMKLGETANVSGTLTGLDGPVASATCTVRYGYGENTLEGPSQVQVVDGKFSFHMTAEALPPNGDGVVVVEYPWPDYTAIDGKRFTVVPQE